jgi:predicted glycoside hydrolase/deacetylase ChbG (UPF0249 family)
MRYLIVNADDFGMSREVNEGIKKGIEAGVINSVSLMVNMPYFPEAIAYLKKHSEISVGLHFNITEGSALSSPNKVSTIIREDGNFFHWLGLTINMIFRQVNFEEIEGELYLQYEKLRKTGLKISHMDSHHHIHLYPLIFKIFIRFASTHDIKALRCRAFQLKRLLFSLRKLHSLKQFIILLLCFINSKFFNNTKQFYDVAQLYDINWEPGFNEDKFIKLLQELPDNTTEIITHPAILSKSGNLKFLEPRYKGLNLLLSKKVKDKIKELNISYTKRG